MIEDITEGLVECVARALVASETDYEPTEAYLESRRKLARTALEAARYGELVRSAGFLCQRMREFGGKDLGRLTGCVAELETLLSNIGASQP